MTAARDHDGGGPTAVLDLEGASLPDGLALPARYRQAFILVRWNGRPVAQLYLPLRKGQVSGTRLREAVADQVAPFLLDQWLHDFLHAPASSPPATPATVAVCTRDRPEDLDRCLAALERLPDDGQEILVVDSASSSPETGRVASLHSRVRYVREEHPGLNIARNRALREARHPIVAFTDDDAMPDPGWLRGLVRCFADRRVLCATGLTLPLELETEAQNWFERTNGFSRGFIRKAYAGSSHDPFLVARVGAGVSMALRREVTELVGPFDEALDAGTPTRSGGDHDMFTRVLMAGYTIVYEPEALSRHRHRREWSELRDTVYGYGVGVYAYLTGHLVRGELGAPFLALRWLRMQAGQLLASMFGRRDHAPLDLVLAELRGCAAGPRALVRSRRALRQSRDEAG